MNYPIQLRFKKITLTDEMRVLDVDGNSLAYVRQKIFKLKEEIIVYSDDTRQQATFSIRADKIIDWSPTYRVYDPQGKVVASTKRSGARSLFNATYQLMDGNEKLIGTLRERNPWVKFVDSLIGMVPIAELFTGYFLNPKYDLKTESGEVIATLTKRPAFLQGFYTIDSTEKLESMDEHTQLNIILLLMLVTIMERDRG